MWCNPTQLLMKINHTHSSLWTLFFEALCHLSIPPFPSLNLGQVLALHDCQINSQLVCLTDFGDKYGRIE